MLRWKIMACLIGGVSAAAAAQSTDSPDMPALLAQPVTLSPATAPSSVITQTKASGLQPPAIDSLTAEMDNQADGNPAVPMGTLINEANNGDPAAQNNLGVAYFTGRGVGRDIWLALGWFQKAAQQGYAPAEYNAGLAYRQIGIETGTEDNNEQARYWFKKAAEQGHALAQCRLATLYHAGLGGPPDFDQAAYWYRQAAGQGVAVAQANLALMYLQGQGVSEDPKIAFEWFRKAASQGNAIAELNLADMYATGTVVPKNLLAADIWSRRAMQSPVPDIRRVAHELHARIETQMTQSEIVTARQRAGNLQ